MFDEGCVVPEPSLDVRHDAVSSRVGQGLTDAALRLLEVLIPVSSNGVLAPVRRERRVRPRRAMELGELAGDRVHLVRGRLAARDAL